jgi:hypothetical protein
MGFVDRVIALAAGDAKARAYRAHKLGSDDVKRIGVELATLREAAYTERLKAIAESAGVTAAARTLDDVAHQLADALPATRTLAADIVATHNSELQHMLDGLADDADVAAAVKAWQATRGAFKAKQIAWQQGMAGRYQADQDVIGKNKLDIRARMIPLTAEEEHCADIIGRGWMTQRDIDFTIPVHPNCLHALEYEIPFSEALAGKSRVWLGDWFGAESGANAV